MISITKILITLVVMIGVALYFRTNTRQGQRQAKRGTNAPGQQALSTGKSKQATSTWVYALASALIAAGVFVFYLRWMADHTVVEIRVIDGDHQVVYEAYQKDIKGKTFTAIDGRQVTIGENQRIETLTR